MDGWPRLRDVPGMSAQDLARERLGEVAAELAPDLGPERVEALWELVRHLDAWAGRINLTGHKGPREIVERLVADALALAGRVPACGTLVDVGSGAGFPGLPIAVARPELRVTLLEPRQKRHHFQRAACRAIPYLAEVEPLLGRSGETPARPHGAAIAQALAQPDRAVSWLRDWVEPGGWLLLAGGEVPPSPSPLPPDVAAVRVEEYRVCGVPRSLWVGERLG